MRRRGRPVLGGISGFFFGLFLAADLAQWSIRPLDSLGVIGLAMIGALVGVGLGLWAPLRRRETVSVTEQ
jgi:hypothetical protein